MNTILVRFICLMIGYAFGLIQTAFFYGKAHGIDIREHGSGNAGTTNTLRVLGTKAGLIVFFGDFVKALLAVLIVTFTFGRMFPEMSYLLKLYAGVGVVLAHDFPFYLHFHGGKGIAATAGMMMGFHWFMTPWGLFCFFSVAALTHYVSLGSICLYLGFIISLVGLGQLGFLGAPLPIRIEMYIIAGLMFILTLVLHRQNIVRLVSGTERKTYLFKKNKSEDNADGKESK